MRAETNEARHTSHGISQTLLAVVTFTSHGISRRTKCMPRTEKTTWTGDRTRTKEVPRSVLETCFAGMPSVKLVRAHYALHRWCTMVVRNGKHCFCPVFVHTFTHLFGKST